MEFTSAGSSDQNKKTSLFNLRTGEPFEIQSQDIHGRARDVSEFEKLNRVGEGMIIPENLLSLVLFRVEPEGRRRILDLFTF